MAQPFSVPAASTSPTRRTLVFTSSTTWTVPTSALYVDVMVVGGGSGGQGGQGTSSGSGGQGGSGGAITMQKDISLSGVSTVSIVVGAGSNGTVGGTTSVGSTPSQAGYSAFGTYVYSGGGFMSYSGTPAYKGTNNFPYNSSDSTGTNFAPILFTQMPNTAIINMVYPQLQNVIMQQDVLSANMIQGNSLDGTAIGSSGGWGGYGGTSGGGGYVGGIAGGYSRNRLNTSNFVASQTLPWGAASIFTLGTPSAGAVGGSAAGGIAGPIGYAGGGGGGGGGNGGFAGGLGANGAGGGGAGSSTTTGGAGGNAGTNTGSGGGGGGATTSNGTGGAGGNGAAGFVIVSYIGTN
jgi:hypothetical protein